jgi:hypothetical protein
MTAYTSDVVLLSSPRNDDATTKDTCTPVEVFGDRIDQR